GKTVGRPFQGRPRGEPERLALHGTQRKHMRRHLIAFTFVALPVAAVLVHAQPGVKSESALDLSLIDRAADPCVDFYAYACGGWTKSQPIPPDRSAWGVAERLQEENE